MSKGRGTGRKRSGSRKQRSKVTKSSNSYFEEDEIPRGTPTWKKVVYAITAALSSGGGVGAPAAFSGPAVPAHVQVDGANLDKILDEDETEEGGASAESDMVARRCLELHGLDLESVSLAARDTFGRHFQNLPKAERMELLESTTQGASVKLESLYQKFFEAVVLKDMPPISRSDDVDPTHPHGSS